eukprot:1138725-Pelagomonas_calceolata.AAC.4
MIPAAKGSYSFASKAGVHAGHTFVLRPPPCTNRRVDCRSFSRDSDVPAGPATPYQDANVQQWGAPLVHGLQDCRGTTNTRASLVPLHAPLTTCAA